MLRDYAGLVQPGRERDVTLPNLGPSCIEAVVDLLPGEGERIGAALLALAAPRVRP